MGAPEARRATVAAGPNADNKNTDHASVSPAALIGNSTDAQQAAFARVCAALQVRGHEVHQLSGGGFVVARWGMHRVCPDLQSLRAFARQIGAVA